MKIVIESMWMRHPRIWLTIGTLGLLATMTMWLASRESPNTYGTQYTIPEVVAGGTVRLVMPLQRETSRRCSIDTDRTFVDSSGASEIIVENQHTSAMSVSKRETETPGYLVTNIHIPDHAPEGLGIIRTENQFLCPWNPTTYFWRIDQTWDYRVQVKAKP